MYFLRHALIGAALGYFFIGQALSERMLHIREKGGNSDIASVNSAGDLPIAANASQKIISLSKNVTNNPPIASEGGMISSTLDPRDSREHVMEAPKHKAVIIESANGTLTKSKDHDLPLAVVPPRDDGKPSVAKKGVNMTAFNGTLKHLNITHNVNLNIPKNSSDVNKKGSKINSANVLPNHSNSSTNSSVIYKKPKVTELDTDHIMNIKEDNSKENDISIDQIDPSLADKKNKSSDYIVPIVAVILSVPLVAILISVLYKRGTDWWQHRNYKRMDFLIEGMYHN